MAYTTPTTAAGQVLTSAIWNASVRDNIIYLQDRLDNPPRVRAYHSATQSIANATDTAVALNSEFDDTAAMHSTVSNTSRLTIPTGQGGWYFFAGYVEFAANATGQRALTLRYAGTDLVVSTTVGAASAGVTRLTIATFYPAAAATYYELVVNQNSGGALNLSAAPYFIAQRVA
jgi:hypothetical protein